MKWYGVLCFVCELGDWSRSSLYDWAFWSTWPVHEEPAAADETSNGNSRYTTRPALTRPSLSVTRFIGVLRYISCDTHARTHARTHASTPARRYARAPAHTCICTRRRNKLGLWLRLECSLDSLSIVSTDHQIDRGLSVSLRLYEMCHVLVIV